MEDINDLARMIQLLANGGPQSEAEQHKRLEKTRYVTNLFMDWVEKTPELEGMAVLFGASLDGDSCSAVCGGQDKSSPAFDRIAMRLIFNIESERQDTYRHESDERLVDRGHDHGTDE